jgi:hypothetical protein
MFVKNANTHAHGDDHLVVLAHLRRRWSLRGREGFGFSAFQEMKCLFSTAPDAKKRRRMEVTEVTGCGLNVTGHVQSVSVVNMAWSRISEKLTRRGGESGHERSDTFDRGGCLLDSNRTPGVTHPVCSVVRPIGAQCLCASRSCDRTRWRIRSRSTGRVRSCVEAY